MASQTKRQKSSEAYRLMYGTCPDEECQAKLYFPSYDKSIECTRCGQRHERAMLKNIAEVTNPDVALHNLLKNVLLGNVKPKKGADDVKVLGLSNYVCKLISPILTYYGRDVKTGKAKLLKEMGKDEIFDVSILGDRAFLIEEDNLNVIGYGQDKSGSLLYLADTLKDIVSFNDNETRLVPVHADGDGHCLVHAISRALVGRELFWHALRTNLKNHMSEHLDKYKLLFRDFVDKDEWGAIIEECDPYYIPPEGEAHGLRNIHIFGLANVLHRPIILLDSKSGLSSSGDYSGVFLPGLTPPEKCTGKDGSLNKPLCIAWSSLGRNHYIPVVAIKGKGPAKLPSYMVQKSWGMPKEEIKKYIELDNMYRCTVGGDKCLTERYLKQLVSTMEEVFIEKYNVNPSLVADVHQYIYKSSGIVGVHPDEVLEWTKRTVADQQLYRCLMCDALAEYALDIDMFVKGGTLYNLAVKIHKKLDPTKMYSFPLQGAVCSYDEKKDCLVPDMTKSKPKSCAFCSGEMLRQVRADGSIVYFNGDRTTTPCVGGKCPCGFKHFWDGKEYDNLPEIFPISLHWGGRTVTEKVAWFQDETDVTLNSNVFEVAQNLVQQHFPGEFGSERLVQHVVDSILAQSAALLKKDGVQKEEDTAMGEDPEAWSAETASKIILTGPKKKTIHKEELMKSEKEKQVRKSIQMHAPKSQQKKTAEIAAQKAAIARDKEKKLLPVTTSPVTTSEAVPSTSAVNQSEMGTSTSAVNQSGDKKVRLQTSDGRQVMLTLVKEITYTELQKLIYQTVEVPADRQKIRVGFPPKLLNAPVKGEEEGIVQLQHGDKIALEVLPDTSLPVQETMHHSYPPTTSASRGTGASWSSFEEDVQSQTAEKLLSALKEAQHGGDSIDTSIASLGILSAVTGKDFWTYVQSMPHLFSVGGLLYNQVKRDLGLVDGKHCQLPCLPGKVFRYNGQEDRLELCLEPYGHFPVEPNIEHKIQDQGMKGSKEEVKFGASGVIHHGQDRQAFLGQGHSLKSLKTADERMPTDLACAGHKPQARGIHDLCSAPGAHALSNSIVEEPEEEQEEMQVDETAVKPDQSYQRLGPGYSVLNPIEENTENGNFEMFRALAEDIEKTLAENIEEDNSDATRPAEPVVRPMDQTPSVGVENTVIASPNETDEMTISDNGAVSTADSDTLASTSDCKKSGGADKTEAADSGIVTCSKGNVTKANEGNMECVETEIPEPVGTLVESVEDINNSGTENVKVKIGAENITDITKDKTEDIVDVRMETVDKIIEEHITDQDGENLEEKTGETNLIPENSNTETDELISDLQTENVEKSAENTEVMEETVASVMDQTEHKEENVIEKIGEVDKEHTEEVKSVVGEIVQMVEASNKENLADGDHKETMDVDTETVKTDISVAKDEENVSDIQVAMDQ